MKNSGRLAASVALCALLSACGGGGGSSTPAPPPSAGTPTPPGPPPSSGCTIQYQNQTCVAGTLITPATNPPPAPPPPLPNYTDPAQWETAEYRANYGLDQIGASHAYAAGAFGQGVTIAFIDVGNQTNHPEVYGRVDPASTSIYAERGDIVEGDNRWAHGLQCATLALGTRNDNGAHGVAPDATLLYIRVDAGFSFPSLDDFPLHLAADLAQSIDYAVDNGAQIISMSVGVLEDPGNVLYNSVKRATDRGVVIVSALGNYFDGRPDSQKTIVYMPGAYGNDPAFNGRLVLAGASDSTGEISFYSPRAGNRAPAFLLAPGSNMLVPGGGGGRTTILAPGRINSFVRDSGTSFAAPHIAGAIAVVMSGYPDLSASSALQMLFDSAVDVGAAGTDSVNGVGRIDLRPLFPVNN